MNKDFKYEHTVGIESPIPKDMPKEHSSIPVWNSENWFYEDVIIPHKIRSLRRTISEGEAMQFNMMVLDMHPYVADDHFAKNEGIFKKYNASYKRKTEISTFDKVKATNVAITNKKLYVKKMFIQIKT